MHEQQIRDEIRKTLINELFYTENLLVERYGIQMQPGEFYQGFIEPWVNVVKGAFVDLKKVASQVLTTVRLLFTLNQKKAAEIVARQKDRMKKFDAESEKIFQDLGGKGTAQDFMVYSFLLNPGLYIGAKMTSSTPAIASAALDTAREIGLGDISIATVTGDEAEEDALMRRREQDGPVTKALRALEQIFFLAHAYVPGQVLTESLDTDTFTSEIMAGPFGNSIREAQEGIFEAAEGVIGVVNSISAQNQFMAATAQADSLSDPAKSMKQMEDALRTLKTADDESAEAFGDLPQMIKQESARLANDEDFMKSEIEKAGGDDAAVDFESEATKAVLGKTFEETLPAYKKAIEENKKLLQEFVFDLFPEEVLTSDFVSTLDKEVSGFANAMKEAELVLQRKIIA